MKVLFFLEHVISRSETSFSSAQFTWVECIRRAVGRLNGELALVANSEVCDAWNQSDVRGGDGIAFYPVNAFETLPGFNFGRNRNTQGALGEGDAGNPLVIALQQARKSFAPQLVVMTRENAFARHAFAGVPFLFVEEAPLPRLGQPSRTVIETGIHKNSLLARHAEDIRRLPLEERAQAQVRQLLKSVISNIPRTEPACIPAQQALQRMRSEGRVALLVTEPTEGVTDEGAPHSVELENLLHAWAEALPPGWIGVPTYHLGQRSIENLEKALARASTRLRFLPPVFSQNTTELLLLVADGMVTISSTSAMTGLLLQKAVVVTGESPFNAWCRDDPSLLHQAIPLSENEAVSLFCFLTNRYSHRQETLMQEPDRLADILRQATAAKDRDEWFLDSSAWDQRRAESLFDFKICALPNGVWQSTCDRPVLKERVDSVQAQNDSLRHEWSAAVAQRDRVDHERDVAISERDSIHEQWTLAVTDRDRLLGERDRIAAELAALRRDNDSQWQAGNSLEKELAVSNVRGSALQEECAFLAKQLRERVEECTALIVQRERSGARLEEVESRAKRLRKRLDKERSETEALRLQCVALTATQERLNRELASSRSDIERDRNEASRLLAEKEDACAALRGDGLHLRAQVAELREELDLLGDEVLRLTDERDALRDQAQRPHQPDVSLRAEVDELRALCSELRKANDRLQDAGGRATGPDLALFDKTPTAPVSPDTAAAEHQEIDLLSAGDGPTQMAFGLAQASLERDRAVEQLTAAIRERGAVTHELFLALSERDQAQKARVTLIDHSAELQTDWNAQRGHGGDYKLKVEELTAELTESQADFARYQNAIYRSTSWRVTAPIRWIRDLVRVR